jgi:hypothetical protein
MMLYFGNILAYNEEMLRKEGHRRPEELLPSSWRPPAS